jgi:hypothetical protein
METFEAGIHLLLPDRLWLLVAFMVFPPQLSFRGSFVPAYRKRCSASRSRDGA